MVAPSLEMVTDRPLEMSLSIPRGPRVVRMASEMDWHALMLEISWAFPWFWWWTIGFRVFVLQWCNNIKRQDFNPDYYVPEKYRFPLLAG
jgi:hypothetical protein